MEPYATLIEAEAYFQDYLNTAPWDLASNDQKNTALREGTRRLDRLAFRGAKTDASQANEWPRTGVPGVEDDEIPLGVLNANCELALALLDGKNPEKEFEGLGVTSRRFVGVSTTYDRSESLPAYIRAGIPSLAAWTYILPYLTRGRDVVVNRVS